MLSTLLQVWLFLVRTKRRGDIEQNPGPKPYSCQCFSVFHWSLNSISAHNSIKLYLLRPYIAIYNFDVVCLSEIILTLASQTILDSLEVLVEQTTHLILNEKVFVFIIERNSLPLKMFGIHYLQECINFKVIIEVVLLRATGALSKTKPPPSLPQKKFKKSTPKKNSLYFKK